MVNKLLRAVLTVTCSGFFYSGASAQESLLKDVDGNGVVTVSAFGDSLTFGIGEGIQPGEFLESLPEGTSGEGYPGRLSRLLGVPVFNSGVPGEEFLTAGFERFPGIVGGRRPDIVLFMEGTNDAVKKATRGDYARNLQKIINVAQAEGREIIIATLPPPVGVHAALEPFTTAFGTAVRELASLNGVTFADVEQAWRVACPNLEACRFYNLPEGLHPNRLGYSALSQIFAATVLGVNLFGPTGAADLEAALGLTAGDALVGTGAKKGS